MQPHMTKIAQKFAKNRKKLLSLEGGGSSKTPHGFLGGGGLAKKPCRSTRRGGGSKMSKIPSTWFMDAAYAKFINTATFNLNTNPEFGRLQFS